MPPKRRKLSFHDLPVKTGGAQRGTNASDNVAAGAPIVVGAPENVNLTSGVIYASAAPQSYIAVDFDPPDSVAGIRPDRYTIQVSTASDFTASGTITVEYAPSDPDNPLARIDGLPPNTLHYVRLRAIVNGFPGDWTSMSPLADNVNRITTAQDTTAAAQPTGLAGTWIGAGDLQITFTPPTSTNYKDVELKIYKNSGGTLLRTVYNRVGAFVYTAEMNLQDNSGTGDPSLFVEARSRTYSNVINNTSVPTLTTTKSAPTAPGVSHSWSGETDHNGTASADLTFVFTLAADVEKVSLSLNSQTARDVYGGVYTYPYGRNVADNGAPGDPTLSYSAVAVDGLGQSSSATTGTATNEDPPTPTVSLSRGAIAGLFATAGGTKATDFAAYEYVFKRDGTTVKTIESQAQQETYDQSAAADAGYHSWTCVVRQKDLFGLYSQTVTSSAVDFEPFTLAGLRDMVEYSDSEGTAAATLKAALADGVTSSGGITYSA